MLRSSGVMRRRVELTQNWWKDATGALLGSTKTGTVVALLPCFPNRYTFYDDTLGKMVKVNRKSAQRLNADAFCFYRVLPQRKLTLFDMIKFLIGSVNGTDIAFVIAASLLVSLLGYLLPLLISRYLIASYRVVQKVMCFL